VVLAHEAGERGNPCAYFSAAVSSGMIWNKSPTKP
jgi:hypothetical protein